MLAVCALPGEKSKLDATETIDIHFMRLSPNEKTLKFDAIRSFISVRRASDR